MSNTARKARKIDGIRFTKAQKVGTPVAERSFVTAEVHRSFRHDAMPAGFRFSPVGPRSPRRVAAFIKSGGIKR